MIYLVFVSPLVLSAMISLWLGFKLRLILFGAWLSACLAIAVVLMKTTFGAMAFSQQGLTLMAILMVFQITAFVLGLVLVRVRNARNVK